MKTTIKSITSITLLLCAILVSSTTYAQQGQKNGGQKGPPPLPSSQQIEEMVSDMSKEISLSEDQESEVLEIYTAHFEEVEDKTKSGKPDRKEMEALKTDLEKEVNALLTEEQQELYEDYQKKNRPKGKR